MRAHRSVAPPTSPGDISTVTVGGCSVVMTPCYRPRHLTIRRQRPTSMVRLRSMTTALTCSAAPAVPGSAIYSASDCETVKGP
jgi:hypothetical protein